MSTPINVKNVVYALLTDEDAKTYGTPKTIAPLTSMKLDTNTSSEDLYGDGAPQDVATVNGKTAIEFGVNYIPVEVHAELLGHTIDETTGVMIEDKDDVAPYVALGFEVEKLNGSSVFVWYVKGKFTEPSEDIKQKEDKVTFSMPTLKGDFVFRKDGVKRYKSDEDYGTTPPANFLAAVYEPA